MPTQQNPVVTENMQAILAMFEQVYKGAELLDFFPYPEEKIAEAYEFMKWAHEKQLRKGPKNRPYAQHPFMVFILVRMCGGTVDEQIAALLHDVIEDIHKSHPEIDRTAAFNLIQGKFGRAISDLAWYLTNPEGLTKENKPIWQAQQLEDKPEIRMIKISDKAVNGYDTIHDTPNNWDAAKLEYMVHSCRKVALLYSDELPRDLLKFCTNPETMGYIKSD